MNDNFRPLIDTSGMHQYLQGTLHAQRFIDAIRQGNAPDPDALNVEVKLVLLHEEPERLRGFLREIQKLMERTRTHAAA